MKKVSEILRLTRLREQSGVTLALVAVLMVVLVGFTALAVDVSHLLVVKNELQNAADAGALAGARVLYLDSGAAVNENANQEAYDAATANKAISEGGAVAVDVNWISGNTGDVERGHWSFGLGSLAKGFYPNNSLLPVDLVNSTTVELDENLDFINAVQVKARRQDTPAASFFARIFGYQDFDLGAEAVGYIGFAGTLRPADADQPIAICKQAITDDDGNVTCNTGRMFDSGGGTTNNTAAWTNFTQDPCQTASAASMVPLICADGNPVILFLGADMGTVGGVQANVYNDLRDCWMDAPIAKDWRGYPKERWTQTLPVIECPGNNVGPCSELVGAVTVDFVWVKQSGSDPQWTDVPVQMEDWECQAWVDAGRPEPANANSLLDSTRRQGCWQEFADHFNLETYDGTSVGDLTASQVQRTMYFLPDCEPQEPRGITGGENFGILAKIPVLVK